MTTRRYDQLQRRRARDRQAERKRRRESENGGSLRLWALAALLFAGAFWIVAQNIMPQPISAALTTALPSPFYAAPSAQPANSAIASLATPLPATIDISPRVTLRAGGSASGAAAVPDANITYVAAEPTALPLPGVTPLAGGSLLVAQAADRPRPIPPTPLPVSAGAQLGAFCSFGDVTALSVYNWESGQTISLNGGWIAQLPLMWDASQSIWRGYDAAKPFDEPDDVMLTWRMLLRDGAGTERFIDIGRSAQTSALYAYAFDNASPYADRNGRYFGVHPCRAFILSPTYLEYLLSAAAAYQEFNGSYPDLIVPDDPRWQRGFVEPIEATVNVRAIPMAFNNDPVYVIRQPMEIWYAVDARSWGEWAQVKIGNTQGWVHTGYVRFTR
jgi:hypothetical protein